MEAGGRGVEADVGGERAAVEAAGQAVVGHLVDEAAKRRSAEKRPTGLACHNAERPPAAP